jgi:hypothetical protein
LTLKKKRGSSPELYGASADRGYGDVSATNLRLDRPGVAGGACAVDHRGTTCQCPPGSGSISGTNPSRTADDSAPSKQRNRKLTEAQAGMAMADQIACSSSARRQRSLSTNGLRKPTGKRAPGRRLSSSVCAQQCSRAVRASWRRNRARMESQTLDCLG